MARHIGAKDVGGKLDKKWKKRQYRRLVWRNSSGKLGHSCRVSRSVGRMFGLHWYGETLYGTDRLYVHHCQLRPDLRWNKSMLVQERGSRCISMYEHYKACKVRLSTLIVFFQKSVGTLRICVNYRKLNAYYQGYRSNPGKCMRVWTCWGSTLFIDVRHQFWVSANRNWRTVQG